MADIRTAVGNAPEPQFPLRIHYTCTIPAAQSAPDANLGSNGPELYHGKVSIHRSYSSSYICSSVVYGPPHVMLRLGPPCTCRSPFFISLHVLGCVVTLVTSSQRLFRVLTMDIACTLSLVLKDPCPDVLVLSLDLESRTRLFLSPTPRFLVLHPCQSPQGFCGPLVKLSGNTPFQPQRPAP